VTNARTKTWTRNAGPLGCCQRGPHGLQSSSETGADFRLKDRLTADVEQSPRSSRQSHGLPMTIPATPKSAPHGYHRMTLPMDLPLCQGLQHKGVSHQQPRRPPQASSPQVALTYYFKGKRAWLAASFRSHQNCDPEGLQSAPNYAHAAAVDRVLKGHPLLEIGPMVSLEYGETMTMRLGSRHLS
jgi:hypothetical protein